MGGSETSVAGRLSEKTPTNRRHRRRVQSSIFAPLIHVDAGLCSKAFANRSRDFCSFQWLMVLMRSSSGLHGGGLSHPGDVGHALNTADVRLAARSAAREPGRVCMRATCQEEILLMQKSLQE